MKQIWHFKMFWVFTLLSVSLLAQNNNEWKKKPTISSMQFLDIFYTYDFNQPQNTERQPFFYNHNRHNEFNLNLGLVKFALDHSKYRANFALQTGTYANDNYAAEPGLLKAVFEANIGISLNKKNTLWLDAGILPSHIGFESAISMDNPTLTRSILAENSPYYLTGVKFTYNLNAKWEIAGLIANGWQRIQRLEGSSLPSFGTQVHFKPSINTTFNWSTFVGTDDPDTSRRIRLFNNLYSEFQLGKNLQIIAGFDIGIQQQSKNSSKYDSWFSPIIIGKITHSEKWKSTLRVEYYQDKTGIIIPMNTTSGFKTSGFSYNVDYAPIPELMCRVETRWLKSTDNVFQKDPNTTNGIFFISVSMAIKFSEILN